MSSLSTALTTAFRTTPGMIRTRAASDRANSAQAMGLEAIRSNEVPEILVGPDISPGPPWQAAQAGTQSVSKHPPNVVGRQP